MDRFGRARRSRSRSRSKESRHSRSDRGIKAYSGSYRNSSPSRSHRSRSREKRSRDRHRSSPRRRRSRSRHRSRSRGRSGSRRRRSSSSSSDSSVIVLTDPEARKQQEEERRREEEILSARVFVGNLPFGKFEEGDLRKLLDNHGKLRTVNTFVDRGYAFLQYETKEDAERAIEEGRGSIWKGRQIDVKMALEGRRDRFGRRPSPPPAAPPSRMPRDRSPLREDRYPDRYRDPLPRDPLARDPLPRDPLSRDPLSRDPLSRDPLPPRRDDPYYDDPYRRPPLADDPYLDRMRDDRYRGLPPPRPRDPYGDGYRDLPPQRPIPPPECTVLLASEQVRPYGELIIRRVKANGLVASIAVLPEDRTVPQALDDMTRRGTLFAVVITAQNEIHNSVTLNILHGQPQEHRNMPLDDSMALVARSFDRYMQAAREKAAPPPPAPKPAPGPFAAPEPGVAYLLNLLADNHQLTLAELDKVIAYLTDRRNKLRGDPVAPATPATPAVPDAAAVAAARVIVAQERQAAQAAATKEAKQQEAAAIQQRQDLQAKILNLFNGDSAKAGPIMTNALLSLQGHGQSPPGPTSTAQRAPGAAPGSSSALINFDNPRVQKALDSLIQNPQVLQNIASVSGPTVGPKVPGKMVMGGQHGIAPTSLATGSRQPGFPPSAGPPGPHMGDFARPAGQMPRYHNPY